MIRELIYDMVNKFNKIINENYKHYYYIPNEIGRYLGSQIKSNDIKVLYRYFHYLSFKKNI